MSTQRRYDFVTLVQTIVLHQRPPLEISIQILEAATDVPEEAVPKTSLRDAAFHLYQWKMGREGKPKFIQEHEDALREVEEEKKRAVRIRINREAEADTWWLTAEGLAEGIPKSCVDIVCGRGVEVLTVPRRDAEAFRDWGSGIPGWHEGPPFLFENVDGSPAFP